MKKIQGYIIPLGILIIWYIGSSLNLVNSYIVPSPLKIFSTTLYLIKKGLLLKHLTVSLYRVFMGFIFTFIIAFPLAILLSLNKNIYKYLKPTLEFIRHIPPIALIPILILWFGIGEMSKFAVIILATFFPVFLNTLNGILNCDKKLIEVGKMFNFTKRQLFTKIIFPQALPSIMLGMQLGLGYSWRALMGAELVAASSGIGYMIIDAEQMSRPDIIIIGIFTIGIVGYFVDCIFFKITGKLINRYGGKDIYGKGSSAELM